MGSLTRKLISEGLRYGERINKVDGSNPLTIDSVDFFLKLGKGVLKIGKEILF